MQNTDDYIPMLIRPTSVLLAGIVLALAIVGLWWGVNDGAFEARSLPLPAQSWDQENLKRHDTGCPSAIYDAPGGNLRLCSRDP